MRTRYFLSRLKKKIKGKISRNEQKPNSTGTDPGLDQAGSLSRPVPHIVAGGGLDREDSGSETDRQQVYSTDRPPTPAVPAHGADDNQEGEGESIDGREVSQGSRPHSDIEVATGSGPGQDANGADEEKLGHVHPLPSVPSIPHSRKPDGGM